MLMRLARSLSPRRRRKAPHVKQSANQTA